MRFYLFLICSFFVTFALWFQRPAANAANFSCINDKVDNYSDPSNGVSVGDGSKKTLAKPYKVVEKNSQDKTRIVSLLNAAKSNDNLVLFYAKQFLGTPYVAKTLDQEKEECLVINTKQLDCTTYVENVLALAWCAKNKKTTFQDFCDVLAKVRYIGGNVAYTSRQHYFTIWMDDNVKEKLVKHVSLPPAPLSAKRKPKVNYMTTHVADYSMLNAHKQWIKEVEKMEKNVNDIELAYIPKQQLAKSDQYRKYVKDGDIIAIVTNNKGLDISHVGFAVWHKDGLHLMHASSKKKKVIDDDVTLFNYLKGNKNAVGISLVRML